MDKENIEIEEKENNKSQNTPNNNNINNEITIHNIDNHKDLFGDVSNLGFEFSQKTPDLKEYDTSQLTSRRKFQIFIFFLLANLFLNYDTGVIPASLLEIVKEIDLDFKEQALIGSLVYLGLSFASLFVSMIFNKYGPSKVCACVLVLNTFCCFIFSWTKIKYLLFATRFLMGVSEAFIVIYGPVWVNNYSPAEYSATWMGILHSCSALGVIFGYLVAGVTINFFSEYLTWRFAILVQGVAQIPIALYFWLENEKFINVDESDEEEQANNININKTEDSVVDKAENIPNNNVINDAGNNFSSNPSKNDSKYNLKTQHKKIHSNGHYRNK